MIKQDWHTYPFEEAVTGFSRGEVTCDDLLDEYRERLEEARRHGARDAVEDLVERQSLAPAFTHRYLFGPLHTGCNECRR